MKTDSHHRNDLFTLITGASEGIGRAIAENCASRGWNLILVALPGEELVETETYLIENYNVVVYSYAADLTSVEDCGKIKSWLEKMGIRINKLINNAGVGSSGFFGELPANLYIHQIQLNITALTVLTRLLVDDLTKNRPSHILNVGSLGGFCCIPYKSLYAATKSFVNSFTLSLREELDENGINVTVLCPGPVATNEAVRTRTSKHGVIAQWSVINKADVAEKAISGMLINKSIIIPGLVNQILFCLNCILPRGLKNWLIKKEFRKELAT